jgi:MerR family transcriptional regulator, mercuric resistance operon regulatory protein
MQPITDKREGSLFIGALSQQTGVHIETIRYYERIKMLATPPRTAGGRRVYGERHRRALGFIRRARDLGFNLDEIRALLDLDGSGRASCAEVREIANSHLANVRAKLADLASLEAVLSETVARCAANMSPECPVLGILVAAEPVVVDFGRPDDDGAS